MYENSTKGLTSPLLTIEKDAVALIIAMSKCRQSLNVSQIVELISSLIKNTWVERNLISWKRLHCVSSLGTVGKGYWWGFMKRNHQYIVSKTGHNYELDRSLWTKYANFRKMYGKVEEARIESNVAVRLPSPQRQDRDGNPYEEDDTQRFGCNVTSNITRPYVIFVADEVGANISQKEDGAIGGEKKLCARGCVSYHAS